MRIFGLMCQSVNLIWKTAVGGGVGAGTGGIFAYLLVTYKSNFQLNFGALLSCLILLGSVFDLVN